jgi:hypothetical protein
VAATGWEICADVSRTEAHAKVPQKVTPWKNHLAETKPPIGIFARPPVSPCKAIPDASRGHRAPLEFVTQSQPTPKSEKWN